MQWTNCNCIQNPSFPPLWFILTVSKNSGVHNIQPVVTTAHETSNLSRAVLGTTFLLTWWSCTQLSLCCRWFWTCPAQSCFSSTYNSAWVMFVFVAPQSHPGAVCQQCCPLLPAHPSPLVVWAAAASSAHLQPASPVQNRSENHLIS